ncbi:MAG: AarF/UbiB family protein [Rhodothalassiaceae bacterium]
MDHGRDDNRLSHRLRRYARVGTSMGGLGARLAAARIAGRPDDPAALGADLRQILGALKGPAMKAAQLLATIPGALPREMAAELAELQSAAPPMGRSFVSRRMRTELGPDWRRHFADFDPVAAAAASLGQVHRARLDADGRLLAVKLQYPDMASTVAADLTQLDLLFALYRRTNGAVDTAEIAAELRARLLEELDYEREARHMRLYRAMLAGEPDIHVPEPVDALSTSRLLVMDWLEGRKLTTLSDRDQEARNHLAMSLFRAWYVPFQRYGVIHGDPHPGNYSARDDLGLNLLDFGCVRIFPPRFVGGVVDLYHALARGDRDLAVHAYEAWGFRDLSHELIETLNIWASFLYGPLLEDRSRLIDTGEVPGRYGAETAARVHRRLRELGPVRPPREFVLMDRAAIGLGGVFLHLKAEINWHRLFAGMIDDFSVESLTARQAEALANAGLDVA